MWSGLPPIGEHQAGGWTKDGFTNVSDADDRITHAIPQVF